MTWENIYRTILYPSLITMFSIISPTIWVMILLLLLCIISFFLGLHSSRIHDNETFSGKKFFKNFAELTAILGLIALVSIIGQIQGLKPETIQTAGRVIGWAAIYGYLSVINKNLLRFFPHSNTFKFFDFILNVEFFRINKLMERFKNYEKEK